MPSRQDQLHSYQFMVQRVVSALVMRETDPAQSPFRRIAGATLVGVLLATLALGGALAYGLFVPGGSKTWKNPKAVLVEKETGAIFVYREDDRKLYPVLNFASARLLAGDANAQTIRVAHRSLNGVPRGQMIGIPGAPSSLPPKSQLNQAAWTICSDLSADGAVQSTLFVAGGGGNGGRALRSGDGADPVLVVTPTGARYAIIGKYRHLIRDPEILLPGLVWTSRPPVPVAAALLNTLPAGADIARISPTIPGFGETLKKPGGGKVGQVYSVRQSGDATSYFVSLRTGLAELTRLEKDLMMADQLAMSKIGQSEPKNLTRAEFMQFSGDPVQFPRSTGEGALPAEPGNLDHQASSGAICATVDGPNGAKEVRVEVPRLAKSDAAVATGSRSGDGTVLSDRAVVRPGYGVLVTATTSAGTSAGTVSLVTDAGKRYAVPNDTALAALGYAGSKRVRMPAELVSLLPAGPALDPATARNPVVVS
jgi:type VII secretion protein EccB